VPVLVSRVGPPPGPVAPPAVSASAQPSPSALYRQPLELTVDLPPDLSAGKQSYGVLGNAQYMVVRPVPGKFAGHGDVLVYDPGALDTAPFLAGANVRVSGHAAYHVTSFAGDRLGGEAVGWPDPSGAWVVVTGAQSLNGLLALAEYVQVGARTQVIAPYRLAYLPPGARPTAAQVRNGDPSLTNSVVSFGGPGTSTLDELLFGSENGDLVIKAVNRSEGIDSYQQGVQPDLTIAGHNSWWYTDREPGPLVIRQNGAALFVNAGNCQMQLYVTDVNKYPLEELKRIVEGASFRDCTKGSTWVPPLG
jgi:hypothetical protein